MISTITSYTQNTYRPGPSETQDQAAASSVPGGAQSNDGSASATADQRESGLRSEQRVGGSAPAAQAELDLQDQKIIQELSARDREVRTHEQAHQNAGGALTGAASYTYEKGPDGRLYAVGGEVSVQMPSRSGDPQRDIQLARQVVSAALAPAEPSAQDRSVAQAARQIVNEAQAELSSMDTEERENPLVGRTPADQADVEGQNPDSSLTGPATVSVIESVPDTSATTALSPENAVSATTEERTEALVSRVGEYFDSLQQQGEARSERLAEYQESRDELSQRLREFNQKLVDMGVLDSDYFVGSVINDQA
ncbi:putative metalloprotease CJM1_0395 family protein [Marinobacterium mangrovicola]|uniref:SprA family protein n=1 Tax=Marinobacterium mangrovicola TaxID=1476959 RepID=A0A4R1G6C8_9GAMM|nr:putative metalloprotease CJM1_0395 family protein [Marinobacterium mangrovicola]TCK03068.1 SprA family protein [Marinobacterium mangrovicola]